MAQEIANFIDDNSLGNIPFLKQFWLRLKWEQLVRNLAYDGGEMAAVTDMGGTVT